MSYEYKNQQSIAFSVEDSTLSDISDPTELLRQIISQEQGRSVSYDEAAQIGESLITFFEALGGVL